MHDDRIVTWAPHGVHIDIRCSQCGRVGHTKNIEAIGARTLFGTCNCAAPMEPVQPIDAQQRTRDLELAGALHAFINEYVDERTPSLRQLNERRVRAGESLEWVRQVRQSIRQHYHTRVRQLLKLA